MSGTGMSFDHSDHLDIAIAETGSAERTTWKSQVSS